MGLYCMVCGGKLANICISAFVEIGNCYDVQSLWLIMRIVIVSMSSLAAIRAQ